MGCYAHKKSRAKIQTFQMMYPSYLIFLEDVFQLPDYLSLAKCTRENQSQLKCCSSFYPSDFIFNMAMAIFLVSGDSVSCFLYMTVKENSFISNSNI